MNSWRAVLLLLVLAVPGPTLAGDWNGASYESSGAELNGRAGAPQGAPHGALLGESSCTLGSIRSDRLSENYFEFATGPFYGFARSEVTDPLQFGPGGVVGRTIQILPAIFDVTVENLAGADIFWLNILSNASPLSAAEQQDLHDFVEDGGALVIVSDVGGFSSGPNSAAAPFGVAWSLASFIAADPTITDASHPLIDGPFGIVGTIGHVVEGSILNLGANALEIASNQDGSSVAVIPPGALGTSSGPVLLFSDVNEFTSNDTPYGMGINLGDNRVLLRNAVAYLSQVCEPTAVPSQSLWSVAALLLALSCVAMFGSRTTS